MQHRGQRSPESIQRSVVRRLCYASSFVDRIIKETVCKTDSTVVEGHMRHLFEKLETEDMIPEVFGGLVLSNSYGTGALE